MTASAVGRPIGHTRTPIHLWIVGVLGLLWNGMAVFDFVATQIQLEPYMGQFGDEQLAYFYGFPSWVVAAWGIAVFGGFLGALALLLRKRWAILLFGLSLVGLTLSTIYNFGMTDGAAIMGSGAAMFTVVIWLVAILLFAYARAMAKKGVLT